MPAAAFVLLLAVLPSQDSQPASRETQPSSRMHELLAKARNRKKTDRERATAVYALLELGKEAESAIPVLLELLAEMAPAIVIDPGVPPDAVRAEPLTTAASSVLAALGQPAIPGLVELLSHRFVNVNERAARTLARMGERIGPAVLELRRLLSRSDPRAVAAGLAACVELGRAARVLAPDLAELLEGEHHATSDRALDALAAIGAEAVPSLVPALRNQNPLIRQRAAVALRRIGTGSKAALPELERLLDDPNPDVREAAGTAIARIAPARR
jgi:HEAT repeat protein